jgi:hypothetical protein
MANVTVGWKAVRVSRAGSIHRGVVVPELRFLYHSHNGSRIIPTGRWLEAKAKWVYNPGKKKTGTAYRAGFQYLPTRAEVAHFNALTKGKYSFIKVRVRQTWKKPTKNSKSMMARFLFVPDFLKAEFY